MATALSATQPIFSRASNEQMYCYNRFMEYTDPSNIDGYNRGWDLSQLVNLADQAYRVVQKGNPIYQEGGPQHLVIPGRQWELNHLSDIKARLAQAIRYKSDYYEYSVWGMITKFFLKIFGMWNEGNTAAITEAEDFLIMYDSRLSLEKMAEEIYMPVSLFPSATGEWVRSNLDTSRFYNYNPRRAISVVQQFRYDTLDPRNPVVFIRG